MSRTSPGSGAAAALLLAAGLVVTGCGGSGGGALPNTASVTLFDVQTQVFTPSCALSECHVSTNPPFGLDLSSVAASATNLIGVPSGQNSAFVRVVRGNSASSYLFVKITGAAGVTGDQMPAIGGPLSQGEINLVQTWIDEGAF